MPGNAAHPCSPARPPAQAGGAGRCGLAHMPAGGIRPRSLWGDGVLCSQHVQRSMDAGRHRKVDAVGGERERERRGRRRGRGGRARAAGLHLGVLQRGRGEGHQSESCSVRKWNLGWGGLGRALRGDRRTCDRPRQPARRASMAEGARHSKERLDADRLHAVRTVTRLHDSLIAP